MRQGNSCRLNRKVRSLLAASQSTSVLDQAIGQLTRCQEVPEVSTCDLPDKAAQPVNKHV